MGESAASSNTKILVLPLKLKMKFKLQLLLLTLSTQIISYTCQVCPDSLSYYTKKCEKECEGIKEVDFNTFVEGKTRTRFNSTKCEDCLLSATPDGCSKQKRQSSQNSQNSCIICILKVFQGFFICAGSGNANEVLNCILDHVGSSYSHCVECICWIICLIGPTTAECHLCQSSG